LDIQPSVIREWKRRVEAGVTMAVATNEDVAPASALREAQQRIRELERLIGRKQMEVEILQAAQEKDGERWSNSPVGSIARYGQVSARSSVFQN
jgi:hypothetical protein